MLFTNDDRSIQVHAEDAEMVEIAGTTSFTNDEKATLIGSIM